MSSTSFNKQTDRKYKQVSDEELIRVFKQSSDPEIVAELFNRYTHLVYAICLKYLKKQAESEDAVMQIFESLLNDLKKHEILNFKSWLYTVSRNFCLMELRKDKTRLKAILGETEKKTGEFMESLQAEHLLDDEYLETGTLKLKQALDQLNEEQKRCIELKYLEDKSYEEVAGITGFSLKQVKSFIQNGKRNLQILLKKSS
jgi:RNA polymerase sigma factor (sigma-70 family)